MQSLAKLMWTRGNSLHKCSFTFLCFDIWEKDVALCASCTDFPCTLHIEKKYCCFSLTGFKCNYHRIQWECCRNIWWSVFTDTTLLLLDLDELVQYSCQEKLQGWRICEATGFSNITRGQSSSLILEWRCWADVGELLITSTEHEIKQ